MNVRNNQPIDWAMWFMWIIATSIGWLIGAYMLPGFPALVSGVSIASLQWAVLYRRIPKAWYWAAASSIGWAIGWTVIVLRLPPQLEILASSVIGATTGIAQWVILRRLIYWSGWWIPISIIAWTTGLTIIPGALTSGAIPGCITGIALVLLMRYAPKEALHNS